MYNVHSSSDEFIGQNKGITTLVGQNGRLSSLAIGNGLLVSLLGQMKKGKN